MGTNGIISVNRETGAKSYSLGEVGFVVQGEPIEATIGSTYIAEEVLVEQQVFEEVVDLSDFNFYA